MTKQDKFDSLIDFALIYKNSLVGPDSISCVSCEQPMQWYYVSPDSSICPKCYEKNIK